MTDKANLVYVNGKHYKKQEAKISVFDHGFLYGDGVFEGIRAYNGKVFRLKEHLERLFESARAIMLTIPHSIDELQNIILNTLRKNKLSDAYIRVVIARGEGDLGLDPNKCKQPTVVVITDKIQLYPEKYYKDGLEVITVSTRRNIAEALNPRIKSLNYLNNILAKIEVNHANVLEGIMLNREGFVAEATGDNIFLIKKEKISHQENGFYILTPPTYAGILEGITRNAVIELAQKENIKVMERLFTLHEIYTADECFLTGTAAELIPVVKVDSRIIGNGKPGKITKLLLEKFHKLTQEEGTVI